MAEALFITKADLTKSTSLNGNVDVDKFVQYIKISQDIHIQNYLGTDLFEKLQSEVILANSGIPTAITVSNQGTGYTTGTAINTTSATGAGLKLNITAAAGLITNATINTAGTNYKVGDTATVLGGTNGAVTIASIYTIPTDYNNLLVTYVKPMLIHWAMVEYLPWAAYTVANKGVYKHGSENSESVSKEEVDFLVEKERSIAENYTKRFVDYMCFNNNLFPEYNTNSNGDVNPDRDINMSGWYL